MATKLTIEEIDEQIKKLNETKEALKKEAKEKLEAQREERKAEVDEAFNKYIELRDAFAKDYGYYSISREEKKNPRSYSDLFLDFFN